MTPEEERAKQIEEAVKAADKKREDDAAAAEAFQAETTSALGDISAKLGDLTTALTTMSGRLDKIEDSQSDDGEREAKTDQREQRSAADSKMDEALTPGLSGLSGDARRRKVDHALAEAQCRADAVSSAFGLRAKAALHGETITSYRKRLLREHQHNCERFKSVDLDAIEDPEMFKAVEGAIYADSMERGKNPIVPEGQLMEVTRTDRAGRRITEFHGDPAAWMRQFAPDPMYVKSFRTSFRD